jgi:Tfp pilus assembly protein PilV
MAAYWKRQQGYLYMDAVIAIFVLTVALLAITGMFVYATKLNSSASHYTAATNMARQQMELLKRWPASTWSDPSLPAAIPWQGDPDKLTVNKTAFEVRTIIKQTTSIDPSLIQVTVIVSWKELDGTKNVQLITYFSKV